MRQLLALARIGRRARPRRLLRVETGAAPDALRDALALAPAEPLSVHVATDLAAICLLPWAPLLTTESRWRQFALSRLQQQGVDSAAWTLRLSDAAPPHARLAVALPTALIEALRPERAVAIEIRVDLTEHLAQLTRAAPRIDGVMIEPTAQGAWLAQLRDGQLLRVRQRRCGPVSSAAWAAQVAAALSAECADLPVAARTHLVVAAADAGVARQASAALRGQGVAVKVLT